METIVRSILTACTKTISTKGRVITFIGTKESPDRTGDIIRVAGWDFDNFQKNPVFLWNHNPSLPPIGKIIKIVTVGKEVHFDVKFAPASVNEFADLIFKSYAEGFLSAVSVGFIVKDLEPIFSDDGMLLGLDILRQELLELSAVAIPAHQDALAASIYGKRMAAVDENFMDPCESEKFDKALSLEEYRKTLPPFTEEGKPMTESEKLEFKTLNDKVTELEATQKSLITLRESVDLSVETMGTLNKSIMVLLSKDAPKTPAVKQTPDGSTPSPTLDLQKLMGALGTAIEKISESKASKFTVEGDK